MTSYAWFNSTPRTLLRVHLDSLIVGRCVTLGGATWPDQRHIKSTFSLNTIQPHSSDHPLVLNEFLWH